MAKRSIKIRAQAAGDVVTVKCLMKHPMESGLRKDKSGKAIPAHFIQNITAEIDGNEVLAGHMSAAVSKNPYLSFKAKGKSGSTVKISWTDNQGDSDSAEANVR